jgi:isopenicillin N synthase-like dioxygenase
MRGCRDTTKEFMEAMPSVYDRILSCFALGLGYPEKFFREVCPPSGMECSTEGSMRYT